jgi:hypothetical protein
MAMQSYANNYIGQHMPCAPLNRGQATYLQISIANQLPKGKKVESSMRLMQEITVSQNLDGENFSLRSQSCSDCRFVRAKRCRTVIGWGTCKSPRGCGPSSAAHEKQKPASALGLIRVSGPA